MSFKNLENPKKKVYCHICERDISHHTYIFCEECRDIEICVPCFANGQETPKHKRSHAYRVFSRLDFSVLEANWTAVDELLLLEAIETYGYGNWDDIKNHIGGKTKEEVERHFYECYLKNFLKGKGADNVFAKAHEQSLPSYVNTRNLNNLSAQQPAPKEPFKTLLDRKLESLKEVIVEATRVSQKFGIHQNDKGSIYGEILGYMPLREEFDVEYDNDAELFLAEMEFNNDDTEEETKIKYCILEIYNRRLKEREKRKKFVIERGLLNLKEQFAKEKLMSEEEREIRNFLKPYMRFQTAAEHEELVACLLKDLEIKKSIEQLLAAEQIGCETLAELEGIVFSGENSMKLEKKLLDFNSRKKDKLKSITASERRSTRITGQGTYDVRDSLPGHGDIITKNDDSGYNLCFNELALCENLGISFQEYLLVKEFLVRECINKGFLDRKEEAGKIEVKQKDFNQIFDFLASNNIILQKNN